ncbi:hypothetical protein SAMN02745945_02238 [Peptoclostridium litorale DSM 5388]|uniref:Uncharacterized protein n=1 Tax=Peptoclostridium litorale DSM 5388 TaxID=1121324 RepID=A0A069RNI3_PEPLI|nr:hypothetical protein [Peptoclostridium litorale]KDR95747.1 hypothetical protein CLIT_10c04740 [Peptoclostridium litorale DSM 5388]SIO22126.1 hypothetical protein SAMN02745945_02238 [Peptoclostridium litorale DSM 5388]
MGKNESKLLKAIIKLEKGEHGWKLVLEDGDIELLDDMYGVRYDDLPENSKHFKPGKPLNEAMDYILDVVKDNDYTVASKGEDFFELSAKRWDSELSFDIDFKHGLWFEAKVYWSDIGETKVYKAMQAAFEGAGPPVEVYTFPEEDSTSGVVRIQEGKAYAHCWIVWDSPMDFIPNGYTDEFFHDIKKDIENFFIEKGHGYLDGDIKKPLGACINECIVEGSFDMLMLKIKDIESQLYKKEQTTSTEFKKWLQSTTEAYKKKAVK